MIGDFFEYRTEEQSLPREFGGILNDDFFLIRQPLVIQMRNDENNNGLLWKSLDKSEQREIINSLNEINDDQNMVSNDEVFARFFTL